MQDTICQVAGIIMILGALYLLLKEKIYLDPKTGSPTEVDVPFFGRFKVNSPALAIFVLGIIAVAYPLHFDHLNYVKVTGQVKSNTYPVIAYVTSGQGTVGATTGLEIEVPQLPVKNYSPYMVLIAGNAVGYAHVSLEKAKDGKYVIDAPVELIDTSHLQTTSPPAPKLTILDAPKPEGFAK
jgi:hypothetical protein